MSREGLMPSSKAEISNGTIIISARNGGVITVGSTATSSADGRVEPLRMIINASRHRRTAS